MHVRLALAVAGALLLAGCTGDPEPTPKIPDPTSSSPSPTASESETPEAESAEEFIRRWQEAADEMVLSGKTNDFLAVSRGCQACEAYANQVSDVYEQGGSVEFGGSEVLSVKLDASQPPTYTVEVRASRLRIVVPGDEPRTFPAATQRYRMILKPSSDSFVMRNYAVI